MTDLAYQARGRRYCDEDIFYAVKPTAGADSIGLTFVSRDQLDGLA